jgi:NAD(P)-dependent dehydrogenase (short-subunit alcohol dehydrogenase family)
MATPARIFDLTGRTAVVTGASSGLGVTFATALADAGASVVVSARRADRIEAVAAEITEGGGAAAAVPCDVTDAASVDALMDAAIERFGGLHVVVANAGSVPEGGAVPEKIPSELFAQSVGINLVGTFITCQAAARRMLARGGGSIITLGSIAGQSGHFTTPTPYASSKAAIINMTQNLAQRWADRGVRVNAISPGWFPSEMTEAILQLPPFREYLERQTPLGRLGDPEELVGALLLLASDAGSYITGANLQVDGGMSATHGAAPFPDEIFEAIAGFMPHGLGERIMPAPAA